MFYFITFSSKESSLNPYVRFKTAALPRKMVMGGEVLCLGLICALAGVITARLFLQTPCPLGHLVDRIGPSLGGIKNLIPAGVLGGILFVVLGGECIGARRIYHRRDMCQSFNYGSQWEQGEWRADSDSD